MYFFTPLTRIGLLALVLLPGIYLNSCGPGDRSALGTNLEELLSNALFSDESAGTSIDYRWGHKVGSPVDDIYRFCGGVAAGDIDLDGLVDLFFIQGNNGRHLLFRNMGDNQFKEISASVGINVDNHFGCGPTFVDIDGDGDLDLFFSGFARARSYLFKNRLKEDGTLTFVDQTAEYGLDAITALNNVSSSFGDYDQDGWLDMFLAHWGTPQAQSTQHLWKNMAGSRFVNDSSNSQVSNLLRRHPIQGAVKGFGIDYSFLGSFADISNDGYPDLLVVSDFRTSQVLINQQDGTFTDATDAAVIKDHNGMGSALGDIDNDGDLDWFVSAIYSELRNLPGNRFYRNQGTRADGSVEFIDRTEKMGVADGQWGWGSCMADFNLDGILDIFHVNGWNFNEVINEMGDDYRNTHSRLYMSTGQMLDDGLPQLRNITFSAGITNTTQGRGVVCFDADNDGDVDILALNNDRPSINFYRNNSKPEKNFLTVLLKGASPNTAAAGARIYVKTGSVEQMREVNIGSNFISQNPLRQYFGLGTNTNIDTLRVKWPDGPTTTMEDVAADQHLTIDHPNRDSASLDQ